MSKCAAIIAASLVATVFAPNAGADNDYITEHRGWNGLSMLAGLARGMGFEVVTRTAIDWNDIESSDVVFVLYPTKHLEQNHIVAFVRNGGRILLADDFGRADDAISRLSMHRRHGVGVGAKEFYDERSFAPVAYPTLPAHPLAAGVDKLTCNHPAVLTDVRGPSTVFAFTDSEAVVVAGEMDSGRFVVLSDPSVLINRMLEFPGNLRFAHNLLGYLARAPQGGRLVILTGDINLRGEPTEIYRDSDVGRGKDNSIGAFNRLLDQINDYFLTEPSLRVLAIVFALLVLVLAASALPFRHRVDVSGDWTRARPDQRGDGGFASLVGSFDRGAARQSYELPAAVLRDTIVDTLAAATDIEDPLAPEARDELLRRIVERHGSGAAGQFRALERSLRNLPTRAQAMTPWQPRFVSKRDFDRLVTDAEHLCRSLGATAHGG